MVFKQKTLPFLNNIFSEEFYLHKPSDVPIFTVYFRAYTFSSAQKNCIFYIQERKKYIIRAREKGIFKIQGIITR